MRSIEARLNLGIGLSLVLLLVVLGIGVSFSFRFIMEAYVTGRLEHDADSLLAAIAIPTSGAFAELRPGRINPIYHRVFSGHYYRIQYNGRVLRSRSLWDQDLKVPKAAPGEVIRLRMAGPRDQLLLVRVAGYRKDGHDLSIAVADDLSELKGEVRSFQVRYVLFSFGALALLLLVQRFVLRAGLVPVARTRAQLAELGRGERTELDADVPAEIQPLVGEINRLLAALQQRLDRSRNALGNLAHALKTPLTLLARLVESQELAAHPALQADLIRQVEALRHLMERELKRARLAGAVGTGKRVDVAREAQALIGVMGTLYRDKGLVIQSQVPAGTVFPGDREDMVELLGNLLDNACKWARGRVKLVVVAGDTLRLRVEDDGPGRPDDELAALSRRGVRIDEDAVPGHGLGLAIVSDIVAHYGGTLHLGRSQDLGGFRAEVELPLATGGAG